MKQNRINKLLIPSFLFTILIFSFTLLAPTDKNYSKRTIISNIDQTLSESLTNRNCNDAIIIHAKFVGMMEAEFDQNSTKISVLDVQR
jgi:hypothetical protein